MIFPVARSDAHTISVLQSSVNPMAAVNGTSTAAWNALGVGWEWSTGKAGIPVFRDAAGQVVWDEARVGKPGLNVCVVSDRAVVRCRSVAGRRARGTRVPSSLPALEDVDSRLRH